MNTKLPLFAILACALGCEVPPAAASPSAPSPPAMPPPSGAYASAHAQAAAATPAAPSPEPGAGVHLAVADTNGIDPSAVAKIYGTAREALGHCHQPGGGSVRVRVVREGRALRLSIEPGSTLSPAVHDCVLESLSTVDLPETASNVGGPAVPPSGFTSLLTVSW